jgi:hypothetical protein
MSKKRINQKKQKGNSKIQDNSPHSSLCAIAPIIESKGIFQLIHEDVKIEQKKLYYRPTDKLVFVVVGIMSGSEVIYDLNLGLRVDKQLLLSFGYTSCADQSLIHETLNAATGENVGQLEGVMGRIWEENNLITRGLKSCFEGTGTDTIVTIDMDFSGLPISKKAEGSTKGYFPGKKNTYGRQLARVLAPDTQEIITESLYPGNVTSCMAFKAMVKKMEGVLSLDTREKRSHIRLRLDAGFGTNDDINYALSLGYHILTKMYSSNQSRVLAKSVQEWVDICPGSDNKPRQAGWVTNPHRYCRKTKQLAIRAPKKDSGYGYNVMVTTDMSADIHGTVELYDGRSGAPESTFCQDNQGLGMRRRRKKGFVAQQMLVLLNQLAHNLIRWTQGWMTEAVEKSLEKEVEIMPSSSMISTSQNNVNVPSMLGISGGTLLEPISKGASLVVSTLKSFGMKRFVRQILCLSGRVTIKKGKVTRVRINPLYPLVKRIVIAFEALLRPYGIRVSLDET